MIVKTLCKAGMRRAARKDPIKTGWILRWKENKRVLSCVLEMTFKSNNNERKDPYRLCFNPWDRLYRNSSRSQDQSFRKKHRKRVFQEHARWSYGYPVETGYFAGSSEIRSLTWNVGGPTNGWASFYKLSTGVFAALQIHVTLHDLLEFPFFMVFSGSMQQPGQ